MENPLFDGGEPAGCGTAGAAPQPPLMGVDEPSVGVGARAGVGAGAGAEATGGLGVVEAVTEEGGFCSPTRFCILPRTDDGKGVVDAGGKEGYVGAELAAAGAGAGAGAAATGGWGAGEAGGA